MFLFKRKMKAYNIDDLLGRKHTRKDLYLKEVVIADGVENISGQLLCKFKQMTSVIIPKSVESISPYAFYNCPNLTSIFIPESVSNIGFKAFNYCDSLESIIVDENNNYYDSRDNCNAIIRKKDNILVVGCKSTVIPDGVKRIEAFSFHSCKSIVSLKIPQSVSYFSINVLRSKEDLMSIVVDENNRIFDSRDNCNAIIRKSKKALICGCNNTVVPKGVEFIDYRACEGCVGLTTITFPDGVRTIGGMAFYGCKNLTSISLPNSIEHIASNAFSCCGKGKRFYIPRGSKEKFMKLLPRYKNCLIEL